MGTTCEQEGCPDDHHLDKRVPKPLDIQKDAQKQRIYFDAKQVVSHNVLGDPFGHKIRAHVIQTSPRTPCRKSIV